MRLYVAALMLALTALPALGQNSPTDQIVAALQSKGYVILSQERTWLGRGRVVAENDEVRRELVFNPGTGEILRDYAVILPRGRTERASESTLGVAANDDPVPDVGTADIEEEAGDLGVAVDPGSSIDDPVVSNPGKVKP